jgi:hypothetical protein
MAVNVARVCDSGVSLDYSKRPARKMGRPNGWLLTVVCVKTNVLLGQIILPDTKLSTALPYLKAIAARDNFNVDFVVIDDVPLSQGDTIFDVQYVVMLKEVFSVKTVYQDRFHVLHNWSNRFNNMHPLYNSFIINKVRNATVTRNRELEDEVDRALREGRVTISKK